MENESKQVTDAGIDTTYGLDQRIDDLEKTLAVETGKYKQRIAQLEKALRATHVIISQNRGLTLCQGSEWVYILKEINAALDDKGGI